MRFDVPHWLIPINPNDELNIPHKEIGVMGEPIFTGKEKSQWVEQLTFDSELAPLLIA